MFVYCCTLYAILNLTLIWMVRGGWKLQSDLAAPIFLVLKAFSYHILAYLLPFTTNRIMTSLLSCRVSPKKREVKDVSLIGTLILAHTYLHTHYLTWIWSLSHIRLFHTKTDMEKGIRPIYIYIDIDIYFKVLNMILKGMRLNEWIT